MRLRFLLYIVLGTAMLASCVHEDLSPIPPQKGDASLTLTLKMGEVQTKAPGDEVPAPYEWATRNELTVTKCVVAIFRFNESGDPDELVGYLNVGSTQLAPASVNDTLAYQINDVPAKTGSNRILVIANSDLDFSTCLDYEDYQAMIEKTQFITDFDAKKLVKVGYIDKDIMPDNYTEEIIVPMTQLAARVDMKLIVQLPKVIEGKNADYPAEVEEKVFATIGKQAGAGQWTIGGITYTGRECKNHEGHTQYLYNKPYYNPYTRQWETSLSGGGGQKFAEIDNMTIDSITTIGSWGLKLNSITVNNIQTQTPVLIESANTLALKQLEGGPWQKKFTPDSTVVDTFRLTFYTYQKDLYADDEDAEVLNVTIDAKLAKGTYDVKTKYKVQTFGIWIREGGSTNGWSSANEKGLFVPLTNVGAAVGAPVPGEFIDEVGEQDYPKKFVVWINPKKEMPGCNTDGLIHGNLYSTEVLFKSVIVNPEVEYKVVTWGTETKDIPDFE